MFNMQTVIKGLNDIFPFIIIIIVLYFVVLQPQQKKIKEQQKMLSHLKKGDHVICAGGIYGFVDAIHEKTIDVIINKDQQGAPVLLSVLKSTIEKVKDIKDVAPVQTTP